MNILKLGAKVIFSPSTLTATDGSKYNSWVENNWIIAKEVTGTVCYINRAHNWFRVRYEAFGVVSYECFQIVGPRNQYYPRIVG